MNKELEEAIKRALKTKQRGICVIPVEILQDILTYIDNSISKEVIKDKIEEREIDMSLSDISRKDDYVMQVLEELLEGK